MLAPDQNRIDYGEKLIAPEGYELTRAIATTFSLDLNTLLTVPIAMCFGHTLEGAVEHMRIALLEALGQLKDKLTVFYQQGNIKVPDKYNSLFGLLENCLVPVVPDAGEENSAFSSFHPKVWLLRFESVEPGKNVKYRLIVLSRNLTFDRSWDLAAVIDGESRGWRKSANRPLMAFFEEQFESSAEESFSDLIDPEEFVRVLWKLPDNIEKIEFLSTIFNKQKHRQQPISIPENSNALLAVSPFIRGGRKVDALDWLKGFTPDGQRYLLSRKEELDMAGEEVLSGWQCFALNESIIDAEERAQMELSQFVEHELNLHAKLLVVDETDETSSWHLGSANMTQAALGDAEAPPRNSEFMLRLTGLQQYIGVQALMQQWTNEADTGLFVKHTFSPIEADHDEQSDRLLRELEFSLINTEWKLKVDSDDGESFELTLMSEPPKPPCGYEVQVTTLSVLQLQPVAPEVTWDKLKLSQVSALLRFDIFNKGELIQSLVTQAPIEFNYAVNREKAIINELLQNTSQFMNYIFMLLQLKPSKGDILASINRLNGTGEGDVFFSEDSVIFEKLMNAAATSPELLTRIDKLRQQVDEKIIPDDFNELWSVFSQLIDRSAAKKCGKEGER